MNGCCRDKSCTAETCMTLPEGKTCADCAHIKRCTWLISVDPTNTGCDWFPRRFRLPVVQGREGEC